MAEADEANEEEEADEEVEADKAEADEEVCCPRCCSRIMMPAKWITQCQQ